MASAPDDYNHENIACSPALRAASVLFARGIVVAMLLLCAAMITKLSTISMDQNSAIPWQQSRMVQKVGSSAAQLGPLPINLAPSSASVTGQLVSAYTAAVSAAQARLAAMAPASANSSNSPLSGVAPSGGWAAAAGDNILIAAAANWTGYCSIMLPRVCQPMFSDQLSGVGVRLDWGSLLHWDNQTEMLLKERPLLLAMANCAMHRPAPRPVAGAVRLPAMLLPGFGLERQWAEGPRVARHRAWPVQPLCPGHRPASLGDQDCDRGRHRWPQLRAEDDARGTHRRRAAPNALTTGGIERHHLRSKQPKLTTTRVHLYDKQSVLIGIKPRHSGLIDRQKERSYAGQAYTSQLLNTAVVLLLVNASPAADASRDNARRATWLQYFLLNGEYGDFSNGWYTNVGISVLVLLMIQVFTPLLTIAWDVAFKLAQRCLVMRCNPRPSQASKSSWHWAMVMSGVPDAAAPAVIINSKTVAAPCQRCCNTRTHRTSVVHDWGVAQGSDPAASVCRPSLTKLSHVRSSASRSVWLTPC
ncbi:uncharacterized protein HaLaN_05842, partial [Haematococcus lacustris]